MKGLFRGWPDYDRPLNKWELQAVAEIPHGMVNKRLNWLAHQSRPDNPKAERKRLLKLRERFGCTLDLDEWELQAIGDIEPANVTKRLKELAQQSRPDNPGPEFERLLRVRRRWGPS